jgi:hypothetical protein
VFGPALLVGAAGPRPRLARVAGVATVWSTGVLLALPVYFPGERRESVVTGLALLTGDRDGIGVARRVGEALPEEPALATAQVPRAEPVEVAPLPPAAPLAEAAIVLPYEGEGRRLSVPVVFEQHGRHVETFMMLDTGATYTTLPDSLLAQLGLRTLATDPELTLHTANGPRTAKVLLVDRVWLGDLAIEGVAVTTCEDCASDENAGLLGLNVTGGYNLTIDADRREVVLTPRATFDRRLDVRPFTEIGARFVRYPGGRVEVEVDLANRARRRVADAVARVSCGDEAWRVPLGSLEPDGRTTLRHRLPLHDRCEAYQILLDSARW